MAGQPDFTKQAKVQGSGAFSSAYTTLVASKVVANDIINPAPTASILTGASGKTFTGTAFQIALPAWTPGAAASGAIAMSGLNFSQGAITNPGSAIADAITIRHITATGAAGQVNVTGVYSWAWADITMPNQAANGAINTAWGIKITGGAMAGAAGSYQRGIDITMAAATDAAIVITTGVATFADGLAGTPGISFTSDPDTGFYRIGANNIGLSLNGAKVIDFVASQLTMLGDIAMNLGGINGILTHANTVSAKTWTFPDVTGTVVLKDATQTLTAKTLTAPVINGIVTSTGLTLPAFTAGGAIAMGGNGMTGLGSSSPATDFGANLGGTNLRFATVYLNAFALGGTTSGVVTLRVADAAGTWTMTLPAAVGTAGYELIDVAGNGITGWAAPGARDHAFSINQTFAPDIKLTFAPSAAAIDCILPAVTGRGQIGNATYKFALVQALVGSFGDVRFENGYRFVEAEKVGKKKGIALLRPDGSIVKEFN